MDETKPYFEGNFHKPTFIFCCAGAVIVIILMILYAVFSGPEPTKPTSETAAESAAAESKEPGATESEEPKTSDADKPNVAMYIAFVLAFLAFGLAALEKGFLMPAMKKPYYGMRIPFATEKFSVTAPERWMAETGFFPDNIKELHRPGRGQFMFTPKGYWEMHPDDEEWGFESTGRLVYAQRKDKAATTVEIKLSTPYYPFLFIAALILTVVASSQGWAIIVAIIGLVAFLILFLLRQNRQMAILKKYITAVAEVVLKEYEKKVAEEKAAEKA
ncbi:MAG: hypothetical protein E3J72_00395 [Planctomycetota bacterium]|nr:MAG: hypothetical protein E3J72_00395 [Planctomycetota bacterium]